MPRHTSLLATGLLACLALTGCSQASETAEVRAPTTRPAPTASSPVATAAPSETAAETSAPPSPSPSVSAAPPRLTLADRLLPAAELPGFNDGFTWSAGATRHDEPELFGTCQRFAITSIGAMRVAVRDYASANGGEDTVGGELVADFADEKTGAGAMDVLRAWRSKCAEKLRGHVDPRVGELEPVGIEDADAGWYLLGYGTPDGSPDERWFDAQGLVRVGARIALVRLSVLGQDYNYEPGQEPMVAALRQAAAKL